MLSRRLCCCASTVCSCQPGDAAAATCAGTHRHRSRRSASRDQHSTWRCFRTDVRHRGCAVRPCAHGAITSAIAGRIPSPIACSPRITALHVAVAVHASSPTPASIACGRQYVFCAAKRRASSSAMQHHNATTAIRLDGLASCILLRAAPDGATFTCTFAADGTATRYSVRASIGSCTA